MLNAAILSHVLGRPPNQRHPIHLFVDECQYFVSPTISEILGETRKFGLFITLATQRIENLEPSLQDAILGNVGTLWIGSSRHITAEKLARETDISAERIRLLPNLQFFEVATGHPTKCQRLRYIGNRFAMSLSLWKKVMTEQAQKHYRKTSSSGSSPITPNKKQSWSPTFLKQTK